MIPELCLHSSSMVKQSEGSFQRGDNEYSVFIGWSAMESISSFNVRGVNISDDLFQAQHVNIIMKKACQQRYILRNAKTFGMTTNIFYMLMNC